MVSYAPQLHDVPPLIENERLRINDKKRLELFQLLSNSPMTSHPDQKNDHPQATLVDVLFSMATQMEIMTRVMYSTKKTTNDVVKTVNKIQKDQCIIMQKIDDAITEEVTDETYNMTADKIRDLMVEKIKLDKPFYPSDIAIEYGLTYDSVLEAIDILRKEGRIIDQD